MALRVDVGGTAVAHDRILIKSAESALQVVDGTIAVARRMLDGCGDAAAAVGITTPGIVQDDRIELAPNVDGWSDISLRQRVVDGLGIPLVFVLATTSRPRLWPRRRPEPSSA